jgi:molecular chaperone DnaK (HSP70)
MLKMLLFDSSSTLILFNVFCSYDRTLGGLEIQIRLRDYLGKAFNDMKKTKNDVFKNPRAMAKLFKEAGRVKNVLSANVDHFAQVENLIDEQDFRYQVYSFTILDYAVLHFLNLEC